MVNEGPIGITLVAIEVPLVLIRDTGHPMFEAAMAFGNLAVLLAVGTVLWGVMYAPAPPIAASPHELVLVDTSGLGLMFGVALIMFSAHLESVSIEADMRDREKFDMVINLSFWSR